MRLTPAEIAFQAADYVSDGYSLRDFCVEQLMQCVECKHHFDHARDFDSGIRDNAGVLVCEDCAPVYREWQACSGAITLADEPYGARL